VRTTQELIELKRDGGEHSAEEMSRLVQSFVAGEMPDYQMSAWLMAAFIRGLSLEETVWLTDAMSRSGERIDLSGVGRPCVDKHSTGGVADTTTLIVAPLVAACGVPVAKMSGRGLGHTGGTLDKLESIPGFRTRLSIDEFVSQVRDTGVALMAQSATIDPADKLIYALRDVTGTVPSIPFIVSSIISKKVAGGASAVLLDVKIGSGAFMKTEAEARTLARELVRVAEVLGLRASCVISDMDQPLGTAVGNALEVREAIALLRGQGDRRLTSLCRVLAAKMVAMVHGSCDESEAHAMVGEALEEGAALEVFRRWIAAQGGDASIADEPSTIVLSPRRRTVEARAEGFVTALDAERIGRAALALGAGRQTKDAPIDYGAGLVLAVRVGDRVAKGQPLAELFAADDALLEEGERRLRSALLLGEVAPESRPLLLEA